MEYSQGFHRHPKIAFAAPLPVGMTAAADLVDVTFTEEIALDVLANRVRPQLPDGVTLTGAEPLAGAALMARLRSAVYRVGLAGIPHDGELQARLDRLLARQTLERERARGNTSRRYDLRPLLVDLWLEALPTPAIAMRLKAGNAGTARPEEVLAELGFEECDISIERSSLDLASGQQHDLHIEAVCPSTGDRLDSVTS
jgi:radical SAM-linked protein